MSVKTYYVVFITLSIIIHSMSVGAVDCCSQHQGVCGDKCCDDTAIPDKCGNIKVIKLPPRATPKLKTVVKETLLEPPPKWMFIWHDPDTGTRYISNNFPPWYRNIPPYPEDSPRVVVYDEYHRIIDDTNQKLSATEKLKFRTQAESNLQQQQAYQAKLQKQAELQQKKTLLETLFKNWDTNSKTTPEMDKLLDYFAAAGEIQIGMTEEQVRKAWGKPNSMITKKQAEKVLKYKQGQVALKNNRVRAYEKRK
jgi:hypothetical protein